MIFSIVAGILIALLILALFPIWGRLTGVIFSILGVVIFFAYFDELLPFVVGFVIIMIFIVIISSVMIVSEKFLDRSLSLKYVLLNITPAHSDQQKIDKVKKLEILEKLGIKNKEISRDYAYQQSLIMFNEITNSVESELSTFLNQGNFDIIKEEPVRGSFNPPYSWKDELGEVITGSFIINGEGKKIFSIKLSITPINMTTFKFYFSIDCQHDVYTFSAMKPTIKKVKKCLIKYIKAHPEVLSLN